MPLFFGMLRYLILLSAATAALWTAAAMASPVTTWSFYETSCRIGDFPGAADCSPPAPLKLIDFTIGVSPASADVAIGANPPILSQKADITGTFTMVIYEDGSDFIFNSSQPYLFGAAALEGQLSWPDKFFDLAVYRRDISTQYDYFLNPDQGIFSVKGSISSDAGMRGCPFSDTACDITGKWIVNNPTIATPEPSSLLLLLAALIIFLYIFHQLQPVGEKSVSGG